MGTFSVSHWLIVLLVVLLMFGPKKLAGIGKGLGQGLRNFRTGLTSDDVSDEEPVATASKLGAKQGTLEQPTTRMPVEVPITEVDSSEAAPPADLRRQASD